MCRDSLICSLIHFLRVYHRSVFSKFVGQQPKETFCITTLNIEHLHKYKSESEVSGSIGVGWFYNQQYILFSISFKNMSQPTAFI